MLRRYRARLTLLWPQVSASQPESADSNESAESFERIRKRISQGNTFKQLAMSIGQATKDLLPFQINISVKLDF